MHADPVLLQPMIALVVADVPVMVDELDAMIAVLVDATAEVTNTDAMIAGYCKQLGIDTPF